MFEVTSLDYWMDKDGDDEDIKLKECPRCKTPIRISFRHADIVKQKLAEVEEVKVRRIEEEQRFQDFKEDLEWDAEVLVQEFPDIARRKALSQQCEEQSVSVKRISSYETLTYWLHQRKSMAELNTIQNQMNLLKQIYKLREKVKTDLLRNTTHGVLTPPIASRSVLEQKYLQGATEVDQKLNLLENNLMKFQISPQRLTDIRDEVISVGLLLKVRVVQCEIEKRSVTLTFDKEVWLERQGKQLNEGKRLTEEEADDIEATINRIRKECGLEGLTPEERVMIVKAMNFAQGHWYKCPNGHIYAIGNCGGAMEERKCPDCGATIGGTHHRLVQGNQVLKRKGILQLTATCFYELDLKKRFYGFRTHDLCDACPIARPLKFAMNEFQLAVTQPIPLSPWLQPNNLVKILVRRTPGYASIMLSSLLI